MKCSRCGEDKGIIRAIDVEILGEGLVKRVVLCEKCIDALLVFFENKNSKSYITNMYKEVWE